MGNFRCPACATPLSGEQALEQGRFSWPEMHTFWVPCPACSAGMHVMAENGHLRHIAIVSAPGPEWEEIATLPMPGLSLRSDPGFLHVWVDERHYEFPAKETS